MTREEAQAAITKHGSQIKAAAALGVSRKTIRYALETKPASTPRPTPKPAGRSITDFRAEYDKSYIVPRKIRDGLKALGGGWEYEVAFAKLAGVSLADLAIFREDFAEYVVTLSRDSRRAWAGTPASAEAMRKML